MPSDDERLRLAAVMRHGILDTAPEAACDGITALAADLVSVPISIIGFVDRDRIWFKSHHGLDATEIERSAAGGAATLPSIGLRLPAGAATDLRSQRRSPGRAARRPSERPCQGQPGKLIGSALR